MILRTDHKGYTICQFFDLVWIEKGGEHIQSARSFDAAKKIIKALLQRRGLYNT